ncbi:ABC transporter permease subunit [Candidatus Caldatribacterium saccharofermentans]|uniref:ABC transporter permease n=1 Tax=Candidatus Caldatribacterium saccharofermentans TaxID=1454753 RepID=UPI00036564F8
MGMETTYQARYTRREALRQFLMFGSLLLLFLFFSLSSPYFFTFGNIVSIMLATCVNGMLALGVTFVIITGGIDLSIGTVMTLSAVMSGVFITYWRLPVFLGVLGGIATGMLCGFVNGTVISRMKLPPFIATLGMMMIARGLALVISRTTPIYFTHAPSFSRIAMGSVIGRVFPGFDVPNAVLIFILSAVLASILLTRTVVGRYDFAIGSNEEAARLSGLDVDRWKTIIYTLCGIFVGMGGVMMASRLNSAQPALGQGYELEAIAAVVIGGTSLSGGEGSIVGTIVGAFIMSTLTNGLRILAVPQEWQIVASGIIVIGAVYLDIIRRRQTS